MFIHGMYDPKKGREKIMNGDGILTRALPGHYHRPFWLFWADCRSCHITLTLLNIQLILWSEYDHSTARIMFTFIHIFIRSSKYDLFHIFQCILTNKEGFITRINKFSDESLFPFNIDLISGIPAAIVAVTAAARPQTYDMNQIIFEDFMCGSQKFTSTVNRTRQGRLFFPIDDINIWG